MKNDLIKHNDYIKMLQVKKQMSFQQQRIFDTILSVVQDMKKSGEALTILEEGELTLDYNLFKTKLLQGSKIDKINRKVLKEALETMVDIKFTYEIEDEIGAFVIFQKAVINFTTKKLYLTFGKDFRTENLFPASNYTSLSTSFLNKFSSQYARTLYQYFKMFIGKNPNRPFRTEKTDDIEYIKKIMGINPTEHKGYYYNHNNLIKRTIEPAIKQINEFTELECSFKTIKKGGNKITDIQFFFDLRDRDKNYIINNPEDDDEEDEEQKIEPMPLAFISFGEFKKWILKHYTNRDIIVGPLGWDISLVVKISQLGFLTNSLTGKDFSPENAIDLWQWIYKNKHRVGQLSLSRSQILTENFNGFKLAAIDTINNTNKFVKIVKIEVIDDTLTNLDKCNVTVFDGSEKTIENWFTIKSLCENVYSTNKG